MRIDNFQNVSPYANREVQLGPLRRDETDRKHAVEISQPEINATDSEALSKAMEIAKEHLDAAGLKIRLGRGGEKQRFQVEIFNAETNEVIRRFPPDEIIKLAESIEKMNGFVLDQKL